MNTEETYTERVRWVLLDWLALCNWRGSGEQNGMRIDKRDVYEQDRNKIRIEAIRPRSCRTKENAEISQDYAGIRRNTYENT